MLEFKKDVSLSADQLLEHIKEHGITKAKICSKFRKMPANTILYFGKSEHYVSSSDYYTENKNKKFNYEFRYDWQAYWHLEYHDRFELIEDEEPNYNFQWAIDQLKEGKKVKRNSSWYAQYKSDVFDNIIVLRYTSNNDKCGVQELFPCDFESTDWELFEEPEPDPKSIEQFKITKFDSSPFTEIEANNNLENREITFKLKYSEIASLNDAYESLSKFKNVNDITNIY